jgi:hypothetical protein
MLNTTAKGLCTMRILLVAMLDLRGITAQLLFLFCGGKRSLTQALRLRACAQITPDFFSAACAAAS